MNFKNLIILIAIITSYSCYAQQFKVDGPKEDGEAMIILKHLKMPYLDNQKDTCALIIISAPVDTLFFHESSYKHKEYDNGFYYLYVSPSIKFLPIKSNRTNDQEINLDGKISEGLGYRMTLELNFTSSSEDEEEKFKRWYDWKKHNKSNWSFGLNGKYISKDFKINPSLHIALVDNFIPFEFEATIGGNESKGTYIYDSNGNLKDSYKYRGYRFCMRSGYCFQINEYNKRNDIRWMVTLLGGISYTLLSGGQIQNTSNNSEKSGNGGNALSIVGGVRLSYAIDKKWLIHVTPEYNLNLWKDDNFKYISKTDDRIKAWAEGFNISAGIIYRWRN